MKLYPGEIYLILWILLILVGAVLMLVTILAEEATYY
jgi:hypothetical protein